MKSIALSTIKYTLFLSISLFYFSCTNELLDETEELNAIQAQAKTSQTVSLTPIHDAYVQGSSRYNTSIIRIEENNRRGYLMFDLSNIDGQITAASLEFTVSSDPGHGTIEVYLGNGEEWTETNLNSSNQPTTGDFLGSIDKSYVLGSTEKIPLKIESLNPEKTSLILLHKDGNDLAFASRQTTNPPKLNLTYSSSTSSEQTAVADGYYVTVNGKSTNNGLSEASAWNLEHAIEIASAGDVIYVKAGNYGDKELTVKNSGTSGNPIKFIGYTSKPGDLKSFEGSTFNYGDKLNASKMPLLDYNSKQGGSDVSRDATGISLWGNNVELENFQITNYKIAIQSRGKSTVLRNIIMTNLGNQSYNKYEGKGIQHDSSSILIENCFVLNAGAEAISLYNADNSRISYSEVYADNNLNPTDYYFTLLDGTDNSIIENSYAYRKEELSHGGHGFDIKGSGENNVIRNCKVMGTKIEVNFSGVKNNTFEDIIIEGYSISSSDSRIHVLNGANNNTFKNIYIENVFKAIDLGNNNSGASNSSDLSCGYNNTFENIVVNKANRFLEVSGKYKGASAKNMVFKNITLYDFILFRSLYNDMYNFQFINIGITKQRGWNFIYGPAKEHNTIYRNCALFDVQSSRFPAKWNNLGNPKFVVSSPTTTKGPNQFKKQNDSPWINSGSDYGTVEDFEGSPKSGKRDIGAYEY